MTLLSFHSLRLARPHGEISVDASGRGLHQEAGLGTEFEADSRESRVAAFPIHRRRAQAIQEIQKKILEPRPGFLYGHLLD